MARVPQAKRYAQAAFDFAREQSALEAWLKDLQRAREVLGETSLRAYLEHPKVRLAEKFTILDTLLKGLNPGVVNLVRLLTARRAIAAIGPIGAEFQRLQDAYLNRERAEVVTAVPLSEAQRGQVAGRLSSLLGKEVILTARVDPAVLGGVIARVSDRVIDGSIRGRLEGLRKSLVEAAGR